MGFFQNILGGGGPDLGAYQRKKSKLESQLGDLYNQGYGALQEAERSGLYDPNAQLDLYRKNYEYASGVQSKNNAAARRIQGYRPGDSEPGVQANALNTAGQLAYAQGAQAISNQAAQNRLNAYNQWTGMGSGLLGQQIGAVDGDLQSAYLQQQQSNGLFANLLGTAMPYLSGVNLKKVFK